MFKYGSLLSQNELYNILNQFEIPIYDADGNFRKPYQIAGVLSIVYASVFDFGLKSQIIEAMDTLRYLIDNNKSIDSLVCENTTAAKTITAMHDHYNQVDDTELSDFLSTFTIRGGCTL